MVLSEEGDFSRAATRLHLSQSALSRSIQSLEDQLGVQLLEPVSCGLALTLEGKLVEQQARRMISEADALVQDVSLLGVRDASSLTIGAGPYCAEILLPQLLIELAHRYPMVSVTFEQGDSQSLARQLVVGALDMVVVDQRGLLRNPKIALHPLPKHKGALYVRSGHPLLMREHIEIADLHDYPFVSVQIPDALRAEVCRALKLQSHETLRLQAQCNDVSMLKALVSQTDSIMFSPVSAVRCETSEGVLVPLRPVDGSVIALEFELGYRPEKAMSSPVRAAGSMIREAMQA